MIETHYSADMNAAQKIAHDARGEVVASMFRALPKIISSLRYRR